MNKAELRTQYITEGWEVQDVVDWRKVSEVKGKVKYDVNAVSPDNKFGTAQVIVTDDGGASEEAIADGFWKTSTTSFSEALRTFARGLEGGVLFAVKLGEVSEQDEVGLVTAYFTDKSTKTFAVKRRNSAFSHQELA